MRRIVWMLTVSLDGYMSGPDGELDWHMVDDEMHTCINDLLRPMSAIFHGRVTYELMAGVWPAARKDPETPPIMAEFARIWCDMPKYVFSRTLTHADWNTTIMRDVVPDDINAMKAQPGGDIMLGGTTLAAEFMRHDLIDEYRLHVNPVVVGSGIPMFKPSESPTMLQLAETRTFGNGVVLLRYTAPSAGR